MFQTSRLVICVYILYISCNSCMCVCVCDYSKSCRERERETEKRQKNNRWIGRLTTYSNRIPSFTNQLRKAGIALMQVVRRNTSKNRKTYSRSKSSLSTKEIIVPGLQLNRVGVAPTFSRCVYIMNPWWKYTLKVWKLVSMKCWWRLAAKCCW